MLSLVDLRFSKRSRHSLDHISFSFSTFQYELITNQTSSSLLDETSAGKVQDLVDSLNGRIRPQVKKLKQLNLLVYLTFTILGILAILILATFGGSNTSYSATVSPYTNGDNDQRASLILVLLVAFLTSLFYSFWSKYQIGKDILSIAVPVIDRVRDHMRGFGLTIMLPDAVYFPENIDIVAMSPLSPKYIQSDDDENVPKEVLYPGQKSEVEVVVHNKKKGLSGSMSEEEHIQEMSSEDEGNKSGAEPIFFYSPVNNMQTPQFNKPINFQ